MERTYRGCCRQRKFKRSCAGRKYCCLQSIDLLWSRSSVRIIAAIDAAVGTRLDTDPTNDISIMNMSLGIDCGGTYDDNCGPNDVVSQAVDAASSYGIVSVIAAGNSVRYVNYHLSRNCAYSHHGGRS